jgi:cellulose synthase/poly-beta-1,6-N-acetylglucosamine synthase-like glycosyltransferase
MVHDVLLILTALYVIQILTFALAVSFARYPTTPSHRPTVTIVIAARNEEENIRRCLDSMIALTYPRHLLEVIVVDDRSTDATPAVVGEYASRHAFITLLRAEQGTDHLQGKANALMQGIEATSGEILLFTDADCSVPRSWVEHVTSYYTNERVGIVAGFTSLRADTWFEGIQAIDWYALFSVAAATIRLHYPVTAVGNNLSVRRKAYDVIGGYRSTPFSVTEDYALFHAITTNTAYIARFPLNRAMAVASQPCSTFTELLQQKTRWFTGGRDMDAKSLAVFSVSYLLNLTMMVALILGEWETTAVALAVKTLVDIGLTVPTLGVFGRWGLLRYFLLYEVYYCFYVLIFPVIVLIRKDVVWKERRFEE